MGVDLDAVVHGQSGGFGQRGVGDRADAHQHGVGVDPGAVGEPDAIQAGFGDLDAGPQVDPVFGVQVGEHLGGFPAEDGQQRQLEGFQDG